tara:strand:- start:215 stop:415 length:201 start_codon:yes stop_codon:yes gene_type:complete
LVLVQGVYILHPQALHHILDHLLLLLEVVLVVHLKMVSLVVLVVVDLHLTDQNQEELAMEIHSQAQ